MLRMSAAEAVVAQAIAWVGRGARLIGGCCGVGPEHIRALSAGLPRRGTPPAPGG
jgi:homocysteine S-methyltransferase